MKRIEPSLDSVRTFSEANYGMYGESVEEYRFYAQKIREIFRNFQDHPLETTVKELYLRSLPRLIVLAHESRNMANAVLEQGHMHYQAHPDVYYEAALEEFSSHIDRTGSIDGPSV